MALFLGNKGILGVDNQERTMKSMLVHVGMYKLDLKAAIVGQTDTHTHKVSTITLVRIRAER